MNLITALLVQPGLHRNVTALTATEPADHHEPPPEVLVALNAHKAHSRIVRAGAAAVTVWTSADKHADTRPNPWASMVLADLLELIADLSPDDVMAHPALQCRGPVVITGRCLMTGALVSTPGRPTDDPRHAAA